MDKTIQEELRDEMKQNSNDIERYYARKDTLLAHSLMETLRLRPFTGKTSYLHFSTIIRAGHKLN